MITQTLTSPFAAVTRPCMPADASGLRTRVRNDVILGLVADARDKGVFVGPAWSPPV